MDAPTMRCRIRISARRWLPDEHRLLVSLSSNTGDNDTNCLWPTHLTTKVRYGPSSMYYPISPPITRHHHDAHPPTRPATTTEAQQREEEAAQKRRRETERQ